MKIKDILFKKNYDGEKAFIPIADIPVEFLVPENNIMINVQQGENGSNGWEEGYTRLFISTLREQTEEEKVEFRLHLDNLKSKRKKERKLEYLKLKKEFE